jgi:heme-degrading monooxygenase HmoA
MVVRLTQFNDSEETTMTPIILIHPFTVSSNEEQQFLHAWKTVDRYMKQQSGYLETKLCRLLKQANPGAFNYVNVAQWESFQAFSAATSSNEFKSLAKNVLGFSRGAGLYEVFLE